ncbi:MAG: hypothetical protein NBV77_02970 [Bacteroidia bacterium]|nr:hypothetical protein [Bacteroidia bacterium]
MKIQISKPQRLTLFKVMYVLNFIAFFPILWFSFLYLAIQQVFMMALTWGIYRSTPKRTRRKEDPVAKFPITTVLLFFFHLIVFAISLIIFFIAKQNSDGSYRL